MKRDYYEVLGIAKNSAPDSIKSAYRRLALQYHPDKNPGNKDAEEKFKEINEAYEVLSNPEKRERYNQFGHQGVNGMPGGAGAPGGFSDFGDFSSVGDMFGDVFGDIFSGGSSGSRGRRSNRGADLQYVLELTLSDAAKGTQIEIEVPKQESCQVCSGTGAKPGTSSKTCGKCRGSGQVRYSQGFFSFSQTCPQCRGEGKIISEPCAKCSGSGRTKSKGRLKVRIPAGVDEGTSLRVPGAGDAPSRGGAPGDLYVVIHMKKDPRFQRRNDDLITELNLSFPMAVFGGEYEVETLDRKVKLKIPGGTQPGTVLRVRNEGMPQLNGRGKGDLFVKVKVAVPKKLNLEQKEALKNYMEASGEKIDESSTFFKKVFGK